MKKVCECIQLEHFFNTLPAEKNLWVMESKSETCVKKARGACEQVGTSMASRGKVGYSQPKRNCTYCGKTRTVFSMKKAKYQGGRQRGLFCYNWDKPSRIVRCPNNTALFGESKVYINKGMYCNGLVD